MKASNGGHVEVVKYLYDLGGKELLIMTSEVSVWMYVWIGVLADMHSFSDAVMQAHTCRQACADSELHSACIVSWFDDV
jgi:hypothetical protein